MIRNNRHIYPPPLVREGFKILREWAKRLSNAVTKGRLSGSAIHIIDSYDAKAGRGRPFCRPLIGHFLVVHIVKDDAFAPTCLLCVARFRRRMKALLANPPNYEKTEEQLDREESERIRLDEEERKREEE